MVVTAQPLAAQAGLEILRQGGNAVDAAIATAAALTVLEPTSNGIGGDAFALVWDGKELHGLNGSGAAPARLSLEALSQRNLTEMPTHGWLPVTVPGAPRAWADLHARLGRLPLAKLFEAAIHYARKGYPLSPTVARFWEKAARVERDGPEFEGWRTTFMPPGFEPRAGSVWASENHARTLERIAASHAEDFYSGELAHQIDLFARETGGLLRLEDLSRHRSEWVKPIFTTYRDHQVWELPPNGQGIVALEALALWEGFTRESHPRSSLELPHNLHCQIEALKLAFTDAYRYVCDPRFTPIPDLLAPAYLEGRRRLIGETAHVPEAGKPSSGGTVYLCTADSSGMMVSFIQSNYMGFGSGVVVPGTGIALHNRGHNFSLEAGHPNALEPGKRPYHTIIPGFLTRDGEAVGPFGVMGGFMQPQGHMQVLINTLEQGMNPQQALDAPRWQWTGGLNVDLEHGFPATLAHELEGRGHKIRFEPESASFGRGQIIWRDQRGTLVGGSDPRADGFVAAF